MPRTVGFEGAAGEPPDEDSAVPEESGDVEVAVVELDVDEDPLGELADVRVLVVTPLVEPRMALVKNLSSGAPPVKSSVTPSALPLAFPNCHGSEKMSELRYTSVTLISVYTNQK